MDPGFRLVQRFRGAGVGHLGRDQDLRFVDVAQGDVGEIRRSQGRLVKGQVIGIPAVDHQDMDAAVQRDCQMIHPVFTDLGRSVAEPVDLHIAVLKVDAAHLVLHKKRHIRTPGKA